MKPLEFPHSGSVAWHSWAPRWPHKGWPQKDKSAGWGHRASTLLLPLGWGRLEIEFECKTAVSLCPRPSLCPCPSLHLSLCPCPSPCPCLPLCLCSSLSSSFHSPPAPLTRATGHARLSPGREEHTSYLQLCVPGRSVFTGPCPSAFTGWPSPTTG